MSAEENRKQLERFMQLTALVAAISAIAFILAAQLGDKPENDAPGENHVEERQ